MTKYKIMKYEREDGFQFFSIVESDDNSSNSIELTEQEFLFLGNLFSFLFFEEGLVELKDNLSEYSIQKLKSFFIMTDSLQELLMIERSFCFLYNIPFGTSFVNELLDEENIYPGEAPIMTPDRFIRSALYVETILGFLQNIFGEVTDYNEENFEEFTFDMLRSFESLDGNLQVNIGCIQEIFQKILELSSCDKISIAQKLLSDSYLFLNSGKRIHFNTERLGFLARNIVPILEISRKIQLFDFFDIVSKMENELLDMKLLEMVPEIIFSIMEDPVIKKPVKNLSEIVVERVRIINIEQNMTHLERLSRLRFERKSIGARGL